MTCFFVQNFAEVSLSGKLTVHSQLRYSMEFELICGYGPLPQKNQTNIYTCSYHNISELYLSDYQEC